MPPRTPDDTRNQLIELAAAGCTMTEASQQTGMSVSSIWAFARRNSISFRKPTAGEQGAATEISAQTPRVSLHQCHDQQDTSIYPPLPDRTADGAYEAASLLRYLERAKNKGLRSDQIAWHLKIPMHRLAYIQGGGLSVFKRRAAQ